MVPGNIIQGSFARHIIGTVNVDNSMTRKIGTSVCWATPDTKKRTLTSQKCLLVHPSKRKRRICSLYGGYSEHLRNAL